MATIKIKTSITDGRCRARILIRHPMSVGGPGEEPHFIRLVECAHNDAPLMTAHWGAGISKNPYLSFRFSGAAPGDRLTVRWYDNAGMQDSLEVVL